uniref:Uncharacterized protein n=1 Tax=Leptobrachium leishanense TaxID=445787 RepID=A0A8C5Q6C9_9ANUR
MSRRCSARTSLPQSSCVQGRRHRDGREHAGHIRSVHTVVLPAVRPSTLCTSSRAGRQTSQHTHPRNLVKKKDAAGSRKTQNTPQDGTDSLAPLRAICQRFEEENTALMRKIIKDEKTSMEKATEKLQQYNKAGCNAQAVTSWGERQLREAEQDLRETREKGEQRLKELQNQLDACDHKLRDAHKELHQLREYRDREHSVRVLQVADLQRQLQSLTDTYQDHLSDVEALAKADLQNLLKNSENQKDIILQKITQHHIDLLPPSIKRICLENQQMRKDIAVHQKVIGEIKKQLVNLRASRKSLQTSAREEIDKMCHGLLLQGSRCFPEEDVVLNIPVNEDLPI